VPGPKCRSAVGSILSEGDQRPSADLQERYEKSGFRIFTFPEVTHVVSSRFPFRTRLSIILGVLRVYPRLGCYIKDRQLCAHPFLEIYRNHLIYYMSPLARQGDFYVPEVQKAPKRQPEGEDSEDDKRTDIT
ncbi:testis-expressed sequence protein, partial [Clarias magur]